MFSSTIARICTMMTEQVPSSSPAPRPPDANSTPPLLAKVLFWGPLAIQVLGVAALVLAVIVSPQNLSDQGGLIIFMALWFVTLPCLAVGALGSLSYLALYFASQWDGPGSILLPVLGVAAGIPPLALLPMLL